MANYKHFVITLFNLRRVWLTDKKNKETCTEEWLSKRFDLFDTYCFPSIVQQENKDFIWLCLLDDATPDKYKNLIKEYEVKCPQMKACYFSEDEMDNWQEHIRDIIKTYLTGDEEYLMTTNTDTDDSLHKNMINTLHQQFEKDHKEGVYSILIGYQYFMKLNLMLKMRYPHSHFLTLVEKYTPDFKTVKCKPHGQIRRFFDTVDIKTDPYWVEFVHDTNINNDLRITSRIKYYPVFKEVSLKDFGLDITISKSSNIINTIFKMPWLFTKTAVRKLIKKAKKKKK
ncbi:MAG: glycosyltransferase [Dysgonomonas sp.]|nr:glycosyltransferase [Dysgonomonas sp.]